MHMCAVLAAAGPISGGGPGLPVCWGSGSAVLGSPSSIQTNDALLVSSDVQLASVSAGLNHNCGLTANGEIYCWGLNSHGQLGTPSPGGTCGSNSCSLTPSPVADTLSLRSMAVAGNATCGITSDSLAVCWGSNQSQQLATPDAPDVCNPSGGGSVDCSKSPIKIELPTAAKVISLSVGLSHACAVTADGAAYCWGDPEGGKVGNKDIQPGSGPVAPVRVSEPGG